MGLFNFKITPRVKDRDWEVRVLYSSRKRKRCETCKKEIPLTSINTSFTKRKTTATYTDYTTYYTHGGKDNKCIIALAKKLNVKL